MKIELLDYASNRVSVDVGDLDDIAKIVISVISGDEVLEVIYKDYTSEVFDSSTDRMMDFYDDEYEIYNVDEPYNLIDIPEFINRKTSYWRSCLDF